MTWAEWRGPGTVAGSWWGPDRKLSCIWRQAEVMGLYWYLSGCDTTNTEWAEDAMDSFQISPIPDSK